jgi:hypothetical protein
VTDGRAGALILLGAVVVGLVVLARLIDLWRRRRRERAALRGVVTDAVMAEERLAGVTIVPRVRIPFWSGSPVSVVLTGRVPDPEAHVTAVRVARAAAASVRTDLTFHDFLVLDGPGADRRHHAA